MKTLPGNENVSGLTLIGILAFVTAAIAAPHDWVLKTGKTITGDYVSSGTTTLVVKTGGTNCFLKISNLSSNDLAFVAKMQVEQRQARLADYVLVFGGGNISDRALSRHAKTFGIPIAPRGRRKSGT